LEVACVADARNSASLNARSESVRLAVRRRAVGPGGAPVCKDIACGPWSASFVHGSELRRSASQSSVEPRRL